MSTNDRSPQPPFPNPVLGLLLIVAIGCGRGGPGPTVSQSIEATSLPWPERPDDGYIGSAACTRCHEEAARDYHSHPMSRSTAAVLDAVPLEDYAADGFRTLPAVEYAVEKTADGVLHHERRYDADGKLIYDQGLPVHYAVGSGVRGRTYLINFDGRLYASPVSWFADPEGWALSPGYAPENHARFERRVSHGCISCHVGRSEPHPDDLDRFTNPVVEAAIGCERCHGPGRDHIAFHDSSAGDGPSRDTIVNPADLTGARQDAVCNQCHLLGHRRVVRYGRTEFDFRPGMLLSDNWIVFLKTLNADGRDAAAVSQVEQMYSSKCYTATDGALTCLSCHDGHQVLRNEQAALAFRSRCVECHSAEDAGCTETSAARRATVPADSCTACHMPKFPAEDVHASQTDHRILKRPAVINPEGPRSGPVAHGPKRALLFHEPGAVVPRLEVDRARGIFLAEQASGFNLKEQAKEAVNLLLPVLKGAPKDIEGRYALGQALETFGDSTLAMEAWKQVLELQPTHESALENMALLHLGANRPQEAQPLLERLVDINPERSFYFGRLAFVMGLNGELQKGIAAAERALELNPSLVHTHIWLAEAYRRLGDQKRADEHAALAERFRGSPTPMGEDTK